MIKVLKISKDYEDFDRISQLSICLVTLSPSLTARFAKEVARLLQQWLLVSREAWRETSVRLGIYFTK